MKILIPIKLPPGKVWPFETYTIYYILRGVSREEYEIFLPSFDGTPIGLKCKQGEVENGMRQHMADTIGRFIAVIDCDDERFDAAVNQLEPWFAVCPTFAGNLSGTFTMGQLEFKISYEEDS